MKKILIAIAVFVVILMVSLPIYGEKKDNSGDEFDSWKGTLGFIDVPRNAEYEDPSGHVLLNYNSGKDEWVVNVVVKGLIPGVKYQVMFMNGPIVPLGCGYPNDNGILHIKARGFAEEIDPTQTFSSGEARVNVRLANDDCSGIGNSAVLTSVEGYGSGLIPVVSNRPE